MLNKEEIERAKSWLSALDAKSEYEAISKEIVLQYIEELESDKQKLIEKLEKDIEQYRKEINNTHIKLNQIHYMKRIEYAKEILAIVKGEKE